MNDPKSGGVFIFSPSSLLIAREMVGYMKDIATRVDIGWRTEKTPSCINPKLYLLEGEWDGKEALMSGFMFTFVNAKWATKIYHNLFPNEKLVWTEYKKGRSLHYIDFDSHSDQNWEIRFERDALEIGRLIFRNTGKVPAYKKEEYAGETSGFRETMGSFSFGFTQTKKEIPVKPMPSLPTAIGWCW